LSRTTFSYSMNHPTLNKEVPLGHDLRSAYSTWNALYAQINAAPDPLPVTWLLKEFAVRNRPDDPREKAHLTGELKDLSDFLHAIGDSSVTKLGVHHCQEYRNASTHRAVAVETRIRRLRQVWNWARQEGFIDCECPWIAQNRHAAICTEVSEIVRLFLPLDVLECIDSLGLDATSQSNELEAEVRKHLQTQIHRAASEAAEQLGKDGRPDLVPVVAACSLRTFVDAAKVVLPRHAVNAKLLIGHSRVEKVANLRLTARGRGAPPPGIERFGSESQDDTEPPDSSQGSAI
jgi:hypothetical protein